MSKAAPLPDAPPQLRLIKKTSSSGSQSDKIRAELNIEKWPAIWRPAKSNTKPEVRILERETKDREGNVTNSRVEVGFTHLGMLTTEEQKMFYALVKQWEDSGKPDSQVFFSDRLLQRLLQKKWGTNVIDAMTKALRKLRAKTAPKLSEMIRKNLVDLGFRQSEFEAKLSQLAEPRATGFDAVELIFSPNPGEPLKPLRSIASSGEISRLMLAIKSALAAQDEEGSRAALASIEHGLRDHRRKLGAQ